MKPIELNGVLHVNKADMEIAYAHDKLGQTIYAQFVASGDIVEDLA